MANNAVDLGRKKGMVVQNGDYIQIKGEDGQAYRPSKNWTGLAVGMAVDFDASSNVWEGKTIFWANKPRAPSNKGESSKVDGAVLERIVTAMEAQNKILAGLGTLLKERLK